MSYFINLLLATINILNNIIHIESINNEIESGTKPNNRIETKIHSKKVDNKGRKILGKSM